MNILAKLLQTKRLTEIIDFGTNLIDGDPLKNWYSRSELLIYKSGLEKLKKAVVIQTKISFMTLYKDQLAWGEIELRVQGFVPHCFTAVKQWAISPFINYMDQSNRAVNQLLEADLVYVQDVTHPELMDDEQLKHLAHHCYQSYDLTLRCFIIFEQQGTVAEHPQ